MWRYAWFVVGLLIARLVFHRPVLAVDPVARARRAGM